MKQDRIVIIDDNMNDVQLMYRLLERQGYAVQYATTGEEGLRTIRDLYPDCILVDYRMPGMDGYEVCRRIKSDAATQSIPVLMLTGADSNQTLVDGLESGADDFVTKSSDVEVIMARVRALLRVKAYQDRIVEQAEQLRKLYEEIKQKSERIMALNSRFSRDLEFARRVQEALLPQGELRNSHFEIRSAYIPSETLSGDFYDYFLAGEKLYLFVGDVSGHGLPASILVSLLKSFLHSEADEADSLSAFMAQLNEFLLTASLPNQFATALLFRYDPSSRQLCYATAAHPPFLLYRKRDRSVTPYEQPGHILGAIPGVGFDQAEVTVESGDLLFCYTDGLTDRKSVSGEFYSLDRIAKVLQAQGTGDFATLYESIYSDVSKFTSLEEYRDDVAFVVTRFF